jgi:hypothetical protein
MSERREEQAPSNDEPNKREDVTWNMMLRWNDKESV